MKKILCLLIVVILFTGCGEKEIKDKDIKIAVSIVPQETFVKAVAGDLVSVTVLIPPGNSPANYQPSPKQMIDFNEADIYFSIGVPTEKANIIPQIEENNRIKHIDLAKKVSEEYDDRFFGDNHEEDNHEEDNNENIEEEHNHKNARDPHIWLSPKRVKVMIKEIEKSLIEIDPNNKEIYEKNAKEYIAKLDNLDLEIKNIFLEQEKTKFITYHPSFGYFADDYGLEMIAVEINGKEVTPKILKEVIDLALKEDIKCILYQKEFDQNQARIVAEEIDGKVIEMEPLSKEYISNLKKMAKAISDNMNWGK